MRLLLRLLSLLSMLAALVILVLDIRAWGASGAFTLRPLGQVWFQIDAGSLNLVQAVLERYVWPPLWDALFAVLRLPAAPLLLALGVLVFWAVRPRMRRGFR